jgi:hypothetical protein
MLKDIGIAIREIEGNSGQGQGQDQERKVICLFSCDKNKLDSSFQEWKCDMRYDN